MTDEPSKTSTASHSSMMTAIIKQGSVAERISQLQSRLTSSPSLQSKSSALQRSPRSPVASALSRYSTSNLRSSPRNVPLYSKPLQVSHRHLNTSLAQDGPPVVEKNGSSTVADTKNGDPVQNEGQLSVDEDRARSTIEDTYIEDRQWLGGTSPLSGVDAHTSSQCNDQAHGQFDDVVRTSHDVDPFTLKQDEECISKATPTGCKKSSTSSSSCAYSKIQPFMYKPPESSYVPRRQSQLYDDVKELSPLRLRKVDSLDIITQSPSPTSSSAASPRRRNARSLRRRTFNTKSEDPIGHEDGQLDNQAQALRSVSSVGNLEHVSLGQPSDTTKGSLHTPVYMWSKDLAAPTPAHDIRSSWYIPSVMPRHVQTRQLLRGSHHRGISRSTINEVDSKISANENTTEASKTLLEVGNAVRTLDPLSQDDGKSTILHEESISNLATGDGAYSDCCSDVICRSDCCSSFITIASVEQNPSPTMGSHHTDAYCSGLNPDPVMPPEVQQNSVTDHSAQTHQGDWKVVLTVGQYDRGRIKIEIHPGAQVQIVNGRCDAGQAME